MIGIFNSLIQGHDPHKWEGERERSDDARWSLPIIEVHATITSRDWSKWWVNCEYHITQPLGLTSGNQHWLEELTQNLVKDRGSVSIMSFQALVKTSLSAQTEIHKGSREVSSGRWLRACGIVLNSTNVSRRKDEGCPLGLRNVSTRAWMGREKTRNESVVMCEGHQGLFAVNSQRTGEKRSGYLKRAPKLLICVHS